MSTQNITKHIDIIVSINGQTSFSVPSNIQKPLDSLLYVGGQLQKYNVDYTMLNNTLIWFNNQFSLSTQDEVMLYYI